MLNLSSFVRSASCKPKPDTIHKQACRACAAFLLAATLLGIKLVIVQLLYPDSLFTHGESV